jgi:hypothetical protein
VWHDPEHDEGPAWEETLKAELTSAGQIHRYSWEQLEEEHGFLTDQAVDPEGDPLEAIPAEEFLWVWTR